MIQFIVPVDFSDTSKNAARFAASLCSQLRGAELTLYNVFDKLEAGSDGTPLEDDDEARKSIMELALQSVYNELTSLTNVKIHCVAEEGNDFVDCLESYVHRYKMSMIIMGITGATRVSQIFMGSNTLNVVRRKIAPVVIVPPDAHFTGAKNIMFITDFKDVERTIPVVPLRDTLNMFNATLHVVNVDSEHYVELTEEYKAERDVLHNMLKDYNPEYYFIRLYDFMDAINQFVEDHHIDMILTIPKDQSFIANLFKTTHTSKLAYHSHVPILTVHS
jgi:nucleotide-binding universal stress UspA family protein